MDVIIDQCYHRSASYPAGAILDHARFCQLKTKTDPNVGATWIVYDTHVNV